MHRKNIILYWDSLSEVPDNRAQLYSHSMDDWKIRLEVHCIWWNMGCLDILLTLKCFRWTWFNSAAGGKRWCQNKYQYKNTSNLMQCAEFPTCLTQEWSLVSISQFYWNSKIQNSILECYTKALELFFREIISYI